MKLALLSDIHANLQAFDACLAHAQAVGAQRYALLGDLVGYGADPVAVVQRVIQMAGEGAIVLKGNHDEMAVMPDGANKTLGGSTADWTHAQLDAAQRAYLDALPLTHREDTTLLVHASVDSPGRWRYVDDERSAGASLDACADQPGVHYVFGGHVHQQMLYYRGTGRGLMKFAPTPGVPVPMPRHRQWVATIGSVGQPRDGDPRASCGIYDAERRQFDHFKVFYDIGATQRLMGDMKMPGMLAERLSYGF